MRRRISTLPRWAPQPRRHPVQPRRRRRNPRTARTSSSSRAGRRRRLRADDAAARRDHTSAASRRTVCTSSATSAAGRIPYSQDKDVVMKATVHFAGGSDRDDRVQERRGVRRLHQSQRRARLEIRRRRHERTRKSAGTAKRSRRPRRSRRSSSKAPTRSSRRRPSRITAELADPNAAPLTAAVAAPAPAKAEPAGFNPQFSDAVPQPPADAPANGPRVLLVGGGSSHDFVKFFGATDKATLAPVTSAGSISRRTSTASRRSSNNIDVLVFSANQPISAATRKALIDYANRGGGDHRAASRHLVRVE